VSVVCSTCLAIHYTLRLVPTDLWAMLFDELGSSSKGASSLPFLICCSKDTVREMGRNYAEDVRRSSLALLVSRIRFGTYDAAAGLHGCVGSIGGETGVVSAGEVLRSSAAISLFTAVRRQAWTW
jgi:hypothetical protein